MTSDKTSGVDKGRIRFLSRRSTEFRNSILQRKAAKLTEAAMEQEEAERAEQERVEQQREAERANRKPGTVADGRQRYEQQHNKSSQRNQDGDDHE
ncbi:putative membrane protein [Paenarthrobacter nicotinovorans]|uniref:Membrane protein n=1 Tax=Paenarthrobacter nicotinovorans TaxID=29320 RepID=A0ABT9TJL4_PAENI|nr:hypothetical protein [Paenarthrobacter nicotinovorans]MDQ0101143.1 putative membrane protein [Paenarthrobacter nicotinovorans]